MKIYKSNKNYYNSININLKNFWLFLSIIKIFINTFALLGYDIDIWNKILGGTMKILLLMKIVPDTTNAKIDPETKNLKRDGIKPLLTHQTFAV